MPKSARNDCCCPGILSMAFYGCFDDCATWLEIEVKQSSGDDVGNWYFDVLQYTFQADSQAKALRLLTQTKEK